MTYCGVCLVFNFFFKGTAANQIYHIPFGGHVRFVLRTREGLPSHKVSGYIQVNPYWSAEWALRAGYEVISKFYEELCNAMHGPDYYNNTDAQIDYFDCSHYVDINVGKWNKDYVYIS